MLVRAKNTRQYSTFSNVANVQTVITYNFTKGIPLNIIIDHDIELFKKDDRFEILDGNGATIDKKKFTAKEDLKKELKAEFEKKLESIPDSLVDDYLDQNSKTLAARLEQDRPANEVLKKLLSTEEAGRNRSGVIKEIKRRLR